jgi:hypothetical protein
MYGLNHRRRTTSDASDWSCNLSSILLHDDEEDDIMKSKQPTTNVKFSKVAIVNNSTTAFIIKDTLTPGLTKNIIDRYYQK